MTTMNKLSLCTLELCRLRLELCRLHFDLICCYKIVFRLVPVKIDDFLTSQNRVATDINGIKITAPTT